LKCWVKLKKLPFWSLGFWLHLFHTLCGDFRKSDYVSLFFSSW
jgi:hypothetical protein